VLATTGRPQLPLPAAAVGTRPRRPATAGRLLVAVLGVLVLCSAAARGESPDETVAGAGPGRIVHQATAQTLRQHEGIDFDRDGQLGVERFEKGMDIAPWASGNHLSGKSASRIAVAPSGRVGYETCTRIPADRRLLVLRGLHQLRHGTRLCVYTTEGRVALLTLVRAPRLREPDLVFDYVVWQGTAPESPPPAPVAEGTQLITASLTLDDADGVDVDAGGAVVPQTAAESDVTPLHRGGDLRVDNGAHIARLQPGSPATYAACAGVPPAARVVGVNGIRDQGPDQRICVYTYAGHVAMLTVPRPPAPNEKGLRLNIIVWQGPHQKGPPSPAPWVRDQYPNADETERLDEEATRRQEAAQR
jgi:hypothetical protein